MSFSASGNHSQKKSAYHPIMIIETIKTDEQALRSTLTDRGYRIFVFGINLVAIHADDPTIEIVPVAPGRRRRSRAQCARRASSSRPHGRAR